MCPVDPVTNLKGSLSMSRQIIFSLEPRIESTDEAFFKITLIFVHNLNSDGEIIETFSIYLPSFLQNVYAINMHNIRVIITNYKLHSSIKF